MICKLFSYLKYFKQFYYSSITEIIKFRKYDSKVFIIVEGYAESNNFGDALNVPFIEYLSTKKIVYAKFLPRFIRRDQPTYAVIGSILQWSNNNCIVWGAGFISDKNIKIPVPSKIHLVRGPLTRQIFLENKIECPEVYGDPALLMPFIYNPKIDKKYKLGFLPHFVNKNSEFIKSFENNDSCLIMNILCGQDFKRLISEMLSCEFIVTSSLHGLIIAHSYNIPVLWVKYSVELEGGRFKFDDYLLSVNKQKINPFLVEKHYDIKEYIALMDNEKIEINYFDILNSCPFLNDDLKIEITKSINFKYFKK
jgi:pyruvyltransferase